MSYADFITLLFAFFVVMFATSQTDKGKAAAVSESVKKALEGGELSAMVATILGGTKDDKGKGNAQMKGSGGSAKLQPQAVKEGIIAELLPSLESLTKDLADEIASGKIRVNLEPRGLIVSLQEAAFFPSGGDVIEVAGYGSIEKVSNAVRKLPNPVRLEGHTDSIPISTARFRSNWELSAGRGIAMLELLAGRYEIARKRLAISAYADTAPIDTNDTAEGRQRNRRVDIVILSQLGATAQPGAVPAPAKTEPKPSKSH